jgi:hypothetical protein
MFEMLAGGGSPPQLGAASSGEIGRIAANRIGRQISAGERRAELLAPIGLTAAF